MPEIELEIHPFNKILLGHNTFSVCHWSPLPSGAVMNSGSGNDDRDDNLLNNTNFVLSDIVIYCKCFKRSIGCLLSAGQMSFL